jgi:lipase maturation factor 1
VGKGILWPRWFFLRALGLIFLSAFFSLHGEIDGLNGPNGLLPASEYLHAIAGAMPRWEAIWAAPTLLWLGNGTLALEALIWCGLASSILLTANVWPRLTCALCTLFFLSFVSAAQDFSSYQSDGMLLEAGFISIFFAPAGLRPGLGAGDPPSRLSWFLLVWEWLRIYFESGVVKLMSGDPQWRALTALDHYYENLPLPSWIGWYVQQVLPLWFHHACVVVVFAFELLLVWMALLPRPFRLVCFFLVTPFQAAIILTANYAFLNYIVLVLGILLLDDAFLARAGLLTPTAEAMPVRKWWRALERTVLVWILVATVALAPGIAGWLPRPLLWPAIALEPLRIANRYGLFAVMTENRYEIEFQGSPDGQTWTPYPFRFKPQDVDVAPGIYAPYQPRFEWNLWFASLGGWTRYPWVVNCEARLLQGEPSVLRLFASDPFHGTPPRRVRAVVWQYWFTTRAEKRATGAWWKRELRGDYAPALERTAGGVIRVAP